MFKELHDAFENKTGDLFILQEKTGFSKYILIRSLDTPTLKKIILDKTNSDAIASKQDDLYKELYDIDISIDELVNYIKEEYPEVRNKRKEQEEHLPAIISKFTEVKCGIRNDNMNDVAKALVRDKSIENKGELDRRIDSLLNGTIKGYILWQYYNQVTNDLIEHIVNDHNNVIPTIRKIHDVDFFVRVGDKIIPFDLKITHISNDFFDLYSKGLVSKSDSNQDYNCKENDDYCVCKNGYGELEQIKQLYKVVKDSYDLPNIGKQTKDDFITNLKNKNIEGVDEKLETLSELSEIKKYYKEVKENNALPTMSSLDRQGLINILLRENESAITELLTSLIAKRQSCLSELKTNRKMLEWWNYKFQGERLFKNNNRFFVFLAYLDSFEDARPLKGNVDELKVIIDAKLDEICNLQNLNTINYFYEKDRTLKGPYKINSTSVIYTAIAN